MSRSRSVGLTFGVLSAVSFGAAGPCAKALTDAGFTPLQAVWMRILGAALILAPTAVVLRGRSIPGTVRRHWLPMLAYAVASIALCQTFYFIAASRLPVGVAILLEFTGPVLVVGWLGLVRRQLVPRSAYAGVATAVVGLLAVVQIWSGVRLDPVGVAAGLGAACGNASYFLIVDRLTGRVDPLVLTSGGMCAAALVLLPIAAPWHAPWHLLVHSVRVGTHGAPGWSILAVLIALSTVLAYVAGAAAVQRLSAPVACGVAYIEAVSASVVAWVALGQRLSVAQICGGVVVLGGAYIAQRSVTAPVALESGPGPVLEPNSETSSEPDSEPNPDLLAPAAGQITAAGTAASDG